MARCERPGCTQAAEVAFGFQAEPYVIWLDLTDSADGDRQRAGVLCRRHADAMVVPIGWSLDDRREPTPRLFQTAAAAPTPRPSRPRRSAEHASEASADPTLFDLAPGEATVAELASADPNAGDDTFATPWRPVFDTDDDLDGLLSAKSPLLSRAFRGDDQGRGPRRDP